jgi:hypothetical protein
MIDIEHNISTISQPLSQAFTELPRCVCEHVCECVENKKEQEIFHRSWKKSHFFILWHNEKHNWYYPSHQISTADYELFVCCLIMNSFLIIKQVI